MRSLPPPSLPPSFPSTSDLVSLHFIEFSINGSIVYAFCLASFPRITIVRLLRALRAAACIPPDAATRTHHSWFVRALLMDVWAASSVGRLKTKQYLRPCESRYKDKHFLFSWGNAE